MMSRLHTLLTISILTLFIGCGSIEEGLLSNDDNRCIVGVDDDTIDDSDGKLRVIGRVTYDRVSVNSSGYGLNYNNISKEVAKQVVVKLIEGNMDKVYETTTDDSGNYEFEGVSPNSCIKVLALAKLKSAKWDLKVEDNTNANALYAIESSLYSIDSNSIRVNLNAPSGWDGVRYSSTRSAAPFAILGSIYKGMQKVVKANNSALFPPLIVYWSTDNIATTGSVEDGQIETSHFDGDSLYILGDANSDTDEYDDHVVIHEWGHYFESAFSRTDSIGGGHTFGDKLDIRVAFSEGWGNAFSAIATDDATYFDTMGAGQSQGWHMDIESQPQKNAGWYSEASIQRILYDLYDSSSDGEDNLALGFKPIYDVLVDPYKKTEALTSIFPFITALKKQLSPLDSDKIDDILKSEEIYSIDNIYGESHHNLYSDLQIGDIAKVCTTNENGKFNKLNNRKYIRFTLAQSGTYNIEIKQNNGNRANPNFILYKTTAPFSKIVEAKNSFSNKEESTQQLVSGNYLLDISDYNNRSYSCFDITVN